MNIEQIPFLVIGISHHTAPVGIREAVALDEDEQKSTLEFLKQDEHVNGCLVLSTCNRTEIYISSENPESCFDLVKTWFHTAKQCDYFSHTGHTYTHSGHEAVQHFFKVISSLDSQIVGETQITGQVKEAYNLAFEQHATDSLINKLFNFGIQAQKKVRNETYLCNGAVSISFAGVELAERIFNKLDDMQVLVVGAGETAELAADHFRKKGVTQFKVVNRTLSRAEALADTLGGAAFSLDRLPECIEGTDIIISATASPEYVITHDLVRQVLKKRRHDPLFLIDLAIPRDIDPQIDEMTDVYLYNLDDLQEIVKLNTDKRKNEIPKAMKSVDAVMKDFMDWFATYSMSSTISKLKDYFTDVLTNEINRVARDFPNGQAKELETLKTNLINKLVRQHVKLIKKTNGNADHQKQHLDMIRDLFELDKMNK